MLGALLKWSPSGLEVAEVSVSHGSTTDIVREGTAELADYETVCVFPPQNPGLSQRAGVCMQLNIFFSTA